MSALGNNLGTTFNLPNFVGELFKLTPSETPFLSMAGGLTGGRSVTSKEFTWQTVDSDTSFTTRDGVAGITEGQDPTKQGRVRSEVQNVVQIFQYGWSVSYTKQAATGQLGDGTAARTIAASPIIGSQPVQDELSFQAMLTVERAAHDVEDAFLNNGVKVQPDTNSTARVTQGLLYSLSSNAVSVQTAVPGTQSFDYTSGAQEDLWTSTTAHGLSVGDCVVFTALTNGAPYATNTNYYVITTPLSTTYTLSATPGGATLEGTSDGSAGTAYKRPDLAQANVDKLMRTMFDNGAPMRNTVIFANSYNKQQISNVYGYAPESRNVGGLNINQIETDFGMIGVVLDRHVPINTLLIADMSVIRPVFLSIPAKGHFFSEELAHTGASWNYQLYGEIGLEYGPEQWHGKITGLKGAAV